MVNTSIAKDEIFIPEKVANLVNIINNYEYNLASNNENMNI